MKPLRLFITAIALATAFCCCEKPYNENDEDEKEVIADKEGEEEGGLDDSEFDYGDKGEGDLKVGDTVDVKTFLSAPIYVQIWVKGYIVGAGTGANGKTRYEFEAPFSYDTALLIADDASETDPAKTASICITSKKKLREVVNLKDNPGNKGKRIAVFGFQEKYLKIPGIKAIDAYEFPSK